MEELYYLPNKNESSVRANPAAGIQMSLFNLPSVLMVTLQARLRTVQHTDSNHRSMVLEKAFNLPSSSLGP